MANIGILGSDFRQIRSCPNGALTNIQARPRQERDSKSTAGQQCELESIKFKSQSIQEFSGRLSLFSSSQSPVPPVTLAHSKAETQIKHHQATRASGDVISYGLHGTLQREITTHRKLQISKQQKTFSCLLQGNVSKLNHGVESMGKLVSSTNLPHPAAIEG